MNEFEFKLKTITPLCMRGAKQTPEWRGASVRGMLRWWFRRACWYEEDMRDREKELFGSTERFGSTENASLFRIRCWDGGDNQILNAKAYLKNQYGIKYIAYPIGRDIHQLMHGNLNLKLIFPRGCEEYEKQALYTLWLTLNLGCFGSRSRKGFGSLKVVGCKEKPEESRFKNVVFRTPENADKYIRWLKSILHGAESELTNSGKMGFDVYLFYGSWNELCEKYRDFRRYKIKKRERLLFG